MALLERTNDVATELELKALFGAPPAECGDGLTIPTCQGEWRKEAVDAWRFWLDPDSIDEGEVACP
jgi:hypothetical protein